MLPPEGSAALVVPVTVLDSTVPPAVSGGTATVSVKTAEPTANDTWAHDTEPVAPTGGVEQDHPPGDESDTNVVPAGTGSLNEASVAGSGPLLLAVMV